MKTEKISIFTDRHIDFTADVPETKDERSAGLTYLKEIPEKHGMLYYFSEGEKPRMWTPDTPWSVDFIFIDWEGNIGKISTAKPFSKEIHECSWAHTVLEIKGGECKRLGIEEGDTVFFSKTELTHDNEFRFGKRLYKKVNKRNLSEIKSKNLCFVALAEGGAMGWSGGIQFVGLNNGKIERYMTDLNYIEIPEEMLQKAFPTIKKFTSFGPFAEETFKDKNWHIVYLGYGNHLFVKNKFFDEFSKRTENMSGSDKYVAWEGIAEELLEKELQQKGSKC